jgi:hypothetical protein
MKKWFFGEKKHLDQEKIEQEAQELENLRWLMDNGTREQYELHVRSQRPDATEEQIQELITAFYRRRAEREQELKNAAALRRRS